MIAYHVDRTCLLSKNQIIPKLKGFELEQIFNTYNNEFSAHGIQYLTKQFDNNLNSFLWEIAAEYVRLLKYPQYTSRFQCLFATETLEELNVWKNIFENSAHNVVKIECNKFQKFDAGWITRPGPFNSYKQTNKFENVSFASYCYFADKYWSKQISNSPLWELLVELPCKCIDILED